MADTDDLSLRVLGGVVVVAGDGRRVDVGPAKCQTVLAALALSAGSPVPLPRLIDLVWGDRPPRSAARTLQSYIARLRRDLGPDVIVRQGGAYRLDLDPEAIDVGRFEAHLDGGRFADALAEWGGPPLDGLDASGLGPAITALNERRMVAVEAELEGRVEHDPAATVAELTELTAEHPFREGLWALLMTALYRSGRQADALGAYRTANDHLVEQLGLDPGPRLRRLEQMILGHDDRLAPDPVTRPPVDMVGLGGPDAGSERRQPQAGEPVGNAPRRLGRLIGRDEALTEIAAAMDDYPLVTLVGPGGIGKTSLALAAVGPSPDHGERDRSRDVEVWVVELAEVRSGEHVVRAVADTLGVVDRAGADLTETVAQWLRNRRAVLVLDNCEHVISAVAAFAETALRDCPTLRLLSTSRERLGLSNERIVTVGPLDPARSGAELFIERATATGHLPPGVDRAEIVEICRRLDGIPLAIELAAARVAALSPADLLARLDRDQSLRLLRGGRRSGAGARHRTLRAAIGWSYDLLEPDERSLFDHLSVFTGTFDLAGAEAVATDLAEPDDANDAEVIDTDTVDAIDIGVMLGDLVACSMVTVDSARIERRFRLLEPIRDYAAERLAERGKQVDVAPRHTNWCLDQVRDIGLRLAGWDEIDAVASLEELWPNLRTAFDRACEAGDHHLGRELVRPILGEIVLRSQSELGDWIERLLGVTPTDDEDSMVFGLYWAAHRYTVNQDPEGYERLLQRFGEPDHLLMRHGRAFLASDHETMAECLPEVIAELRQRGDQIPAERAEINLMTALLNTGQTAEHERTARRLLDRYRQSGPPTFLNWTLTSLGYAAAFQGRSDEAHTWFDQAIDVAVPPRTHTPSEAHRAGRAFRRGERQQAYEILRAHITTILDTDNMQAGLLAAIEYVDIMTAAGRLSQARRVVRHLQTTGLLDAEEWRRLITPAALEAATDQRASSTEPERDRRRMLTWIADDLDGTG